jgi:hypothetical protein
LFDQTETSSGLVKTEGSFEGRWKRWPTRSPAWSAAADWSPPEMPSNKRGGGKGGPSSKRSGARRGGRTTAIDALTDESFLQTLRELG